MPAYVITFKDFKIAQLLNSEAYNDSRCIKKDVNTFRLKQA